MGCSVKAKHSQPSIELVKLSHGYILRGYPTGQACSSIQACRVREWERCVEVLHEINKLLEE